MSVKCREELNTNEKARVEEKEFCRSKNQRPSSTIYIPTQKTRIDEALPGNPQQTLTSTDMQPIHSKVILPNQDDLIKTNKEATRVELSTSDFSNSSGDFMASEDEPSSSSCMISPKQNRNNGYNNKSSDGGVTRTRNNDVNFSQDEGISDGQNNSFSSDESTTYENEECSPENSAKTPKCFTFSSITPPSVEDISANCCNLDWDKWVAEHSMDEESASADRSKPPNLITPQQSSSQSRVNVPYQNKESTKGNSNKSKVILKSIRNPSLPAVVVHSSDCDSSPTLIIREKKPSSKKKKQDQKKNKKKPEPLNSSYSCHLAQNCNVNINANVDHDATPSSSIISSEQKMIPVLDLPSEEEPCEEKKQKEDHETRDCQSNQEMCSTRAQTKAPKPIKIHNLKETSGESLDSPKVKKRRKSIVDIFFSKQQSSLSSNTPPDTPPSAISKNSEGTQDNAKTELSVELSEENRLAPSPASSRLTLRRLSDIVIGKKKDKDFNVEKSCSKDDIGIHDESGHLLSARREQDVRRSSIANINSPGQSNPNNELFFQEERRRMSSFPPSDSNEASVMLQKIHAISQLESDRQDQANERNETSNVKPVESKQGPFKFLSLLSVGKKSTKLSRSSADIPFQMQNLNMQAESDSNQAEDAAILRRNKNNRSKLMHLPISSPQNQNHLVPNVLPQRRCSSPLIAELEAMRKEEDFSLPQDSTPLSKPLASTTSDKTGSITSLPQFSHSFMDTKKAGIDRSGVVVFPKRKIEDVPGIFIPSQKSKPTMSFFSSVPVSSSVGASSSSSRNIPPPTQHSVTGAEENIVCKNLLGVTREGSERRRHSISMSDPALVEKQFSAVKSSFPPLLPRSPYADTTNITIPFIDGRYEHRNNLIKTFFKQK